MLETRRAIASTACVRERPCLRTSERHVSNSSACPIAALTLLRRGQPSETASARVARCDISCRGSPLRERRRRHERTSPDRLRRTRTTRTSRRERGEGGAPGPRSRPASRRPAADASPPSARSRPGRACGRREMRVDGVPLDARPLGDPADRRSRRADARMQIDRGLDDPLPRLRLAPRALLQLVLPIHCTEVYRES